MHSRPDTARHRRRWLHREGWQCPDGRSPPARQPPTFRQRRRYRRTAHRATCWPVRRAMTASGYSRPVRRNWHYRIAPESQAWMAISMIGRSTVLNCTAKPSAPRPSAPIRGVRLLTIDTFTLSWSLQDADLIAAPAELAVGQYHQYDSVQLYLDPRNDSTAVMNRDTRSAAVARRTLGRVARRYADRGLGRVQRAATRAGSAEPRACHHQHHRLAGRTGARSACPGTPPQSLR